MREPLTPPKLRRFTKQLGAAAKGPTRVYVTGGGTAILLGWRATTADLDIKPVPERDEIMRAIPALKDSLSLNVELASPDQFVPPLPDWEARSLFIDRTGLVDWFHYDPYAQCLAKIERGHERDRGDVAEMIRRNLVEPGRF
jgi:hypothetical protein